jgi:hypothetical protein
MNDVIPSVVNYSNLEYPKTIMGGMTRYIVLRKCDVMEHLLENSLGIDASELPTLDGYIIAPFSEKDGNKRLWAHKEVVDKLGKYSEEYNCTIIYVDSRLKAFSLEK